MTPINPSVLERIRVWFANALHFHERIMARFLTNRGWVAFYLDENNRTCMKDFCWMRQWEIERKRNQKRTI